jgi:phosphatidylglycerophosphate synthase
MAQPAVPGTCAHVREHRSALVSIEKRALVWIAKRLPTSINSDHLSALGLGSMLAAGIAFALFRFSPWAAAAVVLCLTANWFGDSLDGTVARVRGHQRPRYGFYVDHVIDLAGAVFLLTGLAVSDLMNPLLAIVLLAAYLLVSAESYLATHAAGIFRMSFLGFGPTELRLLIAAGALKAAQSPVVEIAGVGSFRLFDIGSIVAIIGISIAFIVSALRNTCTLYRAEPLPPDQRGTISSDSAITAVAVARAS